MYGRNAMPDQIEKIYARLIHQGNLVVWGQLYVSNTGRTVGGWLVNSWSENGAPYWHPKMHWFDKKENKLNHVYLNVDFVQSAMNVIGEDTDIDPERAKFIRATVDKWEGEWLAEEGNKL
jgi:hypothetical protein